MASNEFRSRRGNPDAPAWLDRSAFEFTFTLSLSASTVIIETAAWLASGAATSPIGDPITDFGRNKPARERPPFFMPLPIFRSMIEAEEAVEEMDRLSVDPVKILVPE